MTKHISEYTPKSSVTVTRIEDGNYSDKYTPKSSVTVTRNADGSYKAD